MSDSIPKVPRKAPARPPIKRVFGIQQPAKPSRRCRCNCECYWLSRQWRKRTDIEKGCFIILIVCIIAIIGLSIAVHELKRRKSDTNNLCLSKDCVIAAGLILESVDSEVNSCDNFHNFACGGFMEKTLIPQTSQNTHLLFSSTGVDFFTDKLNIFHARVKSIMEDHDNGSHIQSLIMAKTLYSSCLNTEKIEELQIQPLTDMLRNMGNWPVVGGKWEESTFQWKETLSKLSLHGFDNSMFFTLTVTKDNNNDVNLLTISKPLLKFPVDEETFSATEWMTDVRAVNYYYYVVNASVLLGADRKTGEEEMKKVVDFEAKLVELIFKGHSESPMKVPITSLQHLLPQINWLEYLPKILPIKIIGNENVLVESHQSISKILDLVEASPKRTVANFMLWRAVQPSLQYLNKTARDLSRIYEHHFLNTAESQRWFVCLQNVWTSIITPAAMYVRKYVTAEDKNMVEELVNVMRNELKQVVEKLRGLKIDERHKSLDLLDAMDYYLFPDEFLSDDLLDHFYSSLSFNEEEYFHNMLRLFKFLRDVKFKELLNPSTKSHWTNVHFPFHVKYNLGYIYDNTIEIPFYMLIGFNFNGNNPRYISYASLASYLGKEIIQMLPKEVQDKLFSDRDRCSLMQLENENIPILLDESVEIMASLKLAYNAYKNWIIKNEIEPPLPGLNFTPEQLFWITDATMACGKFESDTNQQLEVISRINIPATNLKEFSNDFQCPSGTSMNPKEKCELW